MTKNEYPHFNPEMYDVPVKIATVRKGSHCTHNINYHIIWIPKYRRKILIGNTAIALRALLLFQTKKLGLDLLALEIMPDHIHLFVGAKPTHIPYKIIQKLKGNTALQLRNSFRKIRSLGYKYGYPYKNLWARGYYCGSAGHVSQEAVKRYILEQQGKDIFEYNIFGDTTGQTKIGDFTKDISRAPPNN